MAQTMHIMHYLLTKEEKQMAFGVAVIAVAILILIALGLIF